MNQIKRIKEKLVKLKEVDSIFQLFGAGKHQYCLNSTKTEGELVTFERIHKIQLPVGYRAFLTQVGNGGAGPYYGLEPLENGQYEDLDSPNQAYLIDLGQPFPHTEPWNLDFGEPPEEGAPDEESYYEERDKIYYDSKWINGLLRIANFGCGVFMNLVVNGAEYGTIWVDDRGNEQGSYPDPYFETTERLNFLDWYELWLDRSLEELAT